MEIKDVAGYEGYYSITTQGRVISHYRGGRVLKPIFNTTGYHTVTLWVKGRGRRKVKIHRLVAKAFIPNPLNLQQINHKNMIRSDNRVENLEWVTSQENNLHAVRTKKELIKSGNKDLLKYLKKIARIEEKNRQRFPSQRYETNKDRNRQRAREFYQRNKERLTLKRWALKGKPQLV